MAIKAKDVLESYRKEEAEKLKSISVEKNIDLEYDLGNLLAVDANPLEEEDLSSGRENYLKSLARDNTQLLINEIWKLPIERVEETVLAKLPEPSTILPREKHIPKAKPPTRWEAFAKMKGIKKKKKRDRMVFDEASQEFRPRYGYKRANDPTKSWMLEVPENADPYEDQFAKKLEQKKERVAKNEFQRLRNLARSTGKKIPGAGGSVVTKDRNQSVAELDSNFHLAKAATASMGRFEEKMKHEKPPKSTGKIRKFDSVTIPATTEKEKHMQIVNNIFKKSSQINAEKAANRELSSTFSENVKRPKPNKSSKRSKQGARGTHKQQRKK